VRNHPTASSDLRGAILRSHQAEAVITNLTREFTAVQELRKKQNKRPFKVRTLKLMIYDFIELMIVGIERQAAIKRESETAKYAREHAQDHQKDMESTLAGDSKGVYEDMGLELGEDKVETVNQDLPRGIV